LLISQYACAVLVGRSSGVERRILCMLPTNVNPRPIEACLHNKLLVS
jgi:hypothetical protein